jgi:hypothetical protein
MFITCLFGTEFICLTLNNLLRKHYIIAILENYSNPESFVDFWVYGRAHLKDRSSINHLGLPYKKPELG